MTDEELYYEADRVWSDHPTKCWLSVVEAVDSGVTDEIAEYSDAGPMCFHRGEPEKGMRCGCGQMTWDGQTCRPTLPAEFELDRTSLTDDDIPF